VGDTAARPSTAGTVPAAPGLLAAAAPTATTGSQQSGTATPPAPPAGEKTITSRDGTVLTAIVDVPSGPGPHPLVVFPAPWGFEAGTMAIQLGELSKRGYVVVIYNTRGFFSSGGTVDVAGPLDVSDTSDVITWALQNTPADPKDIGVAGLSYGAGIALLAVAADPRIKAVVSLSGWTDFVRSVYHDNTRSKASINLLKTIQGGSGRPSEEMTEKLDDYAADRNLDNVFAWGRVRSPVIHLDAINAQRPAIFMGAEFGDNFFSPGPQLDFFKALTGPKTFHLTSGDHASNEVSGLLGLPNEEWTSAWNWFDRYLRPGSAPATAAQPAVVQLTIDGGKIEQYPDWASVTRSTTALRLGPNVLGTGELSPMAATDGWSTTINSGTDTTANAGTIFFGKIVESFTHLPPILFLNTVDRRDGAVWQTTPYQSVAHVRGIPTMQLTMTPNVDSGTVVAYLYDTGPAGDSTMISKAVYTYLQASPGKPLTAKLTFDPVGRDIAPGHRLSLVIDTKDDLYYDADRSGGTVAFSSPAAQPSQLVVPLG
jgi:predicted acyl esterase